MDWARSVRYRSLATEDDHWHSRHVIGHLVALAPGIGNRDSHHVPGVVCTGVVIGTLLLYAAVRGMFGKKRK
jgi:hypothetical protein